MKDISQQYHYQHCLSYHVISYHTVMRKWYHSMTNTIMSYNKIYHILCYRNILNLISYLILFYVYHIARYKYTQTTNYLISSHLISLSHVRKCSDLFTNLLMHIKIDRYIHLHFILLTSSFASMFAFASRR